MLKSADSGIKVFVHLANGFDAIVWHRRWLKGEVIGLNEPYPYGYQLAEEMGCEITFSRDAKETTLARLFRGFCRIFLGFDFLHAWRNRAAIFDSDIVWTHTESQYLSIALLMKISRRQGRPLLLAQSIWLIDIWDDLSAIRKRFYRWLITEAAVMTFHSRENFMRAVWMFPEKVCEYVRFGINNDFITAPIVREVDDRICVLAVGNDKHRDWTTLLSAFANDDKYLLHIATSNINQSDVAFYNNVEVKRPRTNDELISIYKWAHVVVLPLKPNLHVSGITALLEAVLAGRPVICSHTGGLNDYFGPEQVMFTTPYSSDELRAAAEQIIANPVQALARAVAAQTRLTQHNGIGSKYFVSRHVEISKRLLGPVDGTDLTPEPSSTVI